MTFTPSSSEDSASSKLDQVIAALLLEWEQGHQPSEQAWIEQHPELKEELIEFFRDHDQIQKVMVAPGLSPGEMPTVATNAGLWASHRALDPDSFSRLENQRFGDYLLIKEIDRGGMGVIFQAQHEKLNRIVAVKMIKSGALASHAEVSRFHAEAKSAAGLDHPNIVPVYDSGQWEGLHYFSMALIEGHTLGSKIAKEPLSIEASVLLAKKVASAIGYAHSRGVIHRDLKPGNILIDDKNEPRITDFGLAHNLNQDQQLTTDGQILGTPAYMPPEQARGQAKAATPAADVYSIGAILYHCLTGQAPHTADHPLDVLLRVQEVDPLPPRKLNPQIPKPLSSIVLKCLEKDPSKRYATAEALELDLERYLRGEATEGGHVSWQDKVRRWCRRQPVLAAHLGGIGSVFMISTSFLISHQDFNYYLRHTTILILWAAISFPLQQLLQHPTKRRQVEAIWGFLDVVAFTLILHWVKGPAQATYLIGYPFIIACSGFYGRSRLVVNLTIQCIIAYLVLCFLHPDNLVPIEASDTTLLGRRYHQPIFFSSSLFLMGLIIRAQVKRLRALSQYFEAQS
jgi:serine/threonine protein kinase